MAVQAMDRFCGKHRGPCLLVVEDDRDLGYAIASWLRKQDIRCVLANSMEEALEILSDVAFIESHFDGCLVDYRLKNASGYEVIERFLRDFPGMPVALMTGYADEPLEIWMEAKGVPVFQKPLDTKAVKVWLQKNLFTAEV